MANGHGGQRNGAGRKPIEVSEESRKLFLKAIKLIQKTDSEEKAKLGTIRDFWETQKGKEYICQMLFGKVPDDLNIGTDSNITVVMPDGTIHN